jgi:hypothetical protein
MTDTLRVKGILQHIDIVIAKICEDAWNEDYRAELLLTLLQHIHGIKINATYLLKEIEQNETNT